MQVQIIFASAPTANAMTRAIAQQTTPIDTKVTTERIFDAMREE
jgi:hypothetical protein